MSHTNDYTSRRKYNLALRKRRFIFCICTRIIMTMLMPIARRRARCTRIRRDYVLQTERATLPFNIQRQCIPIRIPGCVKFSSRTAANRAARGTVKNNRTCARERGLRSFVGLSSPLRSIKFAGYFVGMADILGLRLLLNIESINISNVTYLV